MLDIISVSGVGAAVIRWYHRDTAEHAHFSEASSSLRRFEKLSIFLGTIVKPGVITAVVAKSFIIIEIACDDDIRRTVWWYSVLYCTVPVDDNGVVDRDFFFSRPSSCMNSEP